ncbi:FecR family protein [Dyadobacter sp. CY323]|uniref:FecR family protein n=1 Tax=Dyadobacter sp. CY323 TaxID=2907302 RepID=UPI001F438DF5|nr:FecR family protein [Dyadobacter sp. CY323]MCE6992622.1 FecR family protein [Dyadobacter sp. CY323]
MHLAHLLEKYENGTISASELSELDSWYHSFSPGESALEEDLAKHPELLKTLKLQIWNGIEEQVHINPVLPFESEKSIRARSFVWPYRAAAVLVIGILFTIGYRKLQPEERVSAFRTISTTNNLSKVKLPDGTVIWVKAGSSLRYPKVFDGENRDVFLEGEAFFDVAHQAERPFLVHTSDLTIRVLGTAFNVKSYKDQGTIETTLLRGKVKIEKDNATETSEIILNPNERAVYNKQSKALDILKTVDVAEVLVKDAEIKLPPSLIFDETPFTTVFAALEQRHDVKIHIENKENLNCRLTADLEQEGLVETLQLIKVSHGIEFRIVGNDIYITGKLCQ